MYIQKSFYLGAVVKIWLRSKMLASLCKPVSYLLGLTVKCNDHGGQIYIFYITSGRNLSVQA